MQDYQFKYVSHCLCIFYPESFLFPAPTLHIIEWKGSCKEFLFVQLFFKSDDISRVTFRGNDITKNRRAYREIPPFVPELFVYSHMSNGSLSGKTKSSGKVIEEIYFRRNCMDQKFLIFDDSRVDLKFFSLRMRSVKCLNCLI